MNGVRVDNDLLAFIPADQNVRPLRDQIIIEPLAWEPSKILAVEYHGKPLRGIVRAVGPGRHPLKYDGPKGKRSKSWLSKRFQPTELKTGDIVELGGLELRGYLFPTIMWGGKRMVIAREGDVTGVIESTEDGNGQSLAVA